VDRTDSDVACNVQELEGLEDPTNQEVADIMKKIEVVDRELRPMKQLCEKKVRKKTTAGEKNYYRCTV
jgi:hypothetical protein